MWQGPPGLPHCWNGCVSVVPAFWQCGLVQGCRCVLGGVGFAALVGLFLVVGVLGLCFPSIELRTNRVMILALVS